MQDMALRGVIDPSGSASVIDTACAIWPYFPSAALDTLLAFNMAPDVEEITNLSKNVDLQTDDIAALLAEAWRHYGGILSGPEQLSVTRHILSSVPSSSDAEYDRALRIWIDVVGPRQSSLLREVVLQTDLTDDERQRVWLQAVRVRKDLGPGFFLDVIPLLLLLDDASQTARAVLDAESAVNELFASREQRHDFGKALLRVFANAPTVGIKKGLAGWLKSLAAGGVLRTLGDYTELTVEDVELLSQAFPDSQTVRRWLADHAAE
jgi:hypothetical protein